MAQRRAHTPHTHRDAHTHGHMSREIIGERDRRETERGRGRGERERERKKDRGEGP